MPSLRVLVTNHTLAARTGPELYVRDIALGLLKRGHTPIAYSPILGDIARELREATVPVIDDLNLLGIPPDVIHGHQHIDTMTALLHFPRVPAIYFCHSWSHWYDKPLIFPRILRYVAVDNACRDRLLLENGIPEERIRVLLNFVDLQRFWPREHPLPKQPARALLFSNYANERTQLPAVRAACEKTGLTLDVVGSGGNNANPNPERILSDYDIVFAKAKCALEALASGAAVVLCDASGVGPMVTVNELDRLRYLNFGVRTLREPLSTEAIIKEIRRYDPEDATETSRIIRSIAGHEAVVDELVALYEEVRQEHERAGPDDIAAEGRAAAAYLRQLKVDFAAHGAASLRLRERLERWPLIGRIGISIAQRITKYPAR